jgi:hypothetical protein
MSSKARERRMIRLIKSLNEAASALSAVTAHEPIDGNDSRARLRREIEEYAAYLERATWWRAA